MLSTLSPLIALVVTVHEVTLVGVEAGEVEDPEDTDEDGGMEAAGGVDEGVDEDKSGDVDQTGEPND